MKKFKFAFIIFTAVYSLSVTAQKSEVIATGLKEYDYAINLYKNKSYLAAQHTFKRVFNELNQNSNLKGDCDYYIAICAVKLQQEDADELMQNFIDSYPTNSKRNTAFIDVGNHYFNSGKAAQALKWFEKANTTFLSLSEEEEFNFRMAYSLFTAKKYTKAKQHFLPLISSSKYGAQAKYYYGYIAYKQDDFDTAVKYLDKIADNNSYNKQVSYYLLDMNFKTGKFEEAVKLGTQLLEKANKRERSNISKIVGESYFNLKKYKEAIPFLEAYRGKRGKLNNTDYYLLGYSHYKQNDFESAISYFNKIIGGKNQIAQNAYYHLAECYLKSNKKSQALNAFRNTSQMDFNQQIKEDAWLNYAKLSYEIGNPYKSTPEVLQDFLLKYPRSPHAREITELIISSFITSKDYQGAIDYLDTNGKSKNPELYQKVVFYRGSQLLNEDQYNEALNLFKIASRLVFNKKIQARATFWKGETNYRLNHFEDALLDFKTFNQNSTARSTDEYKLFHYNLAYTYFKLKDYLKAAGEFSKYTRQNNTEAVRENDSYVRLGDCYFVSRDYWKAMEAYNKVIANKGIDADYAQYQKAISYGFVGRNEQKIATLESFKNDHPRSSYKDDAYYQLGNAYVNAKDYDNAIKTYNSLTIAFKRSSYVPKALLKEGLIFYNTDKNDKALAFFKRIVKNFPNSPEAKQAVANARLVYIDLGNVDEYATWVKNIAFVNVSDSELDDTMYEAAEKRFLENNHERAITAFKKYLINFPEGTHRLKANFYLAQSYFSTNQHPKSTNYYKYVIDQEQSEFTEKALSKLSQVLLEQNDWKSAIPVLERLELEADFPQNITFSQSNLMKGYYELELFERSVVYAEKILQNTKLEDRIKSDAKVIIARSAMKTNNEEKAKIAYKELEKTTKGKLKAEALYYDAYFKHLDKAYENSNKTVQTLIADFSAYKYWGAKSLVIMANNFYKLDDAFQATYILESILKNYTQFNDVIADAQKELKEIKTKEAETNDSVTPDDNQ